MYRWFNPSHPQTMQTAVFLAYFAAVFGLLFSSGGPDLGLNIVTSIGLGAGAFGVANNKRIGYYALIVFSVIRVLLILALLRYSVDVIFVLRFILNPLVFPAALVAAVVHPHTREYQKVWFE